LEEQPLLIPESEVKVIFRLLGEDFPADEVANTMGIEPTATFQNGEAAADKENLQSNYRLETAWEYGTAYEKTFDVKTQLDKVVDPLLSKVDQINEIKETHGLECMIMITLLIEKGETPAMYLEKKHIDFASAIEAEIHWDLYANPYVSDF
jgi:hypothetical protein